MLFLIFLLRLIEQRKLFSLAIFCWIWGSFDFEVQQCHREDELSYAEEDANEELRESCPPGESYSVCYLLLCSIIDMPCFLYFYSLFSL